MLIFTINSPWVEIIGVDYDRYHRCNSSDHDVAITYEKLAIMDNARTRNCMMHKTRMGTTKNTTLYNLIIVGHNVYIECTLILTMKIKCGLKFNASHMNFHYEN